MLNALRHLWFRHNCSGYVYRRSCVCSTPYGIYGFGTRACSQIFPSPRKCAQRLTASMVSARGQGQGLSGLITCSTPYGIYGFGTSSPSRSLAPNSVLNALRHLWFRHDAIGEPRLEGEKCSTPYGIYGFGTIKTANPSTSLLSAQRLTASMVSAQANRRKSKSECFVLNALRHLWFRHFLNFTNALRLRNVLNALRHLWFRHIF